MTCPIHLVAVVGESMTETQYFWGWVVYSAGAIGCLLSLWLVVRKWHARVKRPLMMACAVLFFHAWHYKP